MAKSSFFDDIKQWTEDAKQNVAEESAKTVRTIFTMAVDRSPISSGRFVANWHVGATDVNFSTMETATWDTKIAEINRIFTADYFKTHSVAYMVNNVDYAVNVEYTGWAKTIAYAPVQKTINKIGNGFSPVGQTLGMIAGGIV